MDDHTVLNDEGRGVSFSSRAAVIAGNTPWRGCDVLVVSRNPPSIIKRGSQNSSVGNRMRSTIRSFQVIPFTHLPPPFLTGTNASACIVTLRHLSRNFGLSCL